MTETAWTTCWQASQLLMLTANSALARAVGKQSFLWPHADMFPMPVTWSGWRLIPKPGISKQAMALRW